MTDRAADARTGPSAARTDRFWFEYPNADLPFYDGRPVALSGRGWLSVLLAVALGFASLLVPVPALHRGLGALVPAVLFFAIPLVALAVVARGAWTTLFRKVSPRDVFWMFAFALLNILVTMLVGLLVQRFLGANANPLFAVLPALSEADRLLFLVAMIPQLLGEEILTILPFLAMVTLLYARVGLPRRWAMIAAWFGSAALFGAVHLPTYGWNLAQCLLIIGGARLVLTLPYVMTKNIWVSTGAHIINDWMLLGGAMLLTGLAQRG